MRQFAWAIIITVTIFTAIPLWGLLNNPIKMIKLHTTFYLFFIAIPYAIAIAMLIYSKKR